MASEQSSQSHLPPAWPEAAESSPSWANDSLGTGPRLPLPQDERQSGNGSSWQTSPGGGQRSSTPQADLPDSGRSQDAPPRGDGRPQADGWAQASAPQNSDGWAQATNPQVSSWPDAFSPHNEGWAQATSPQADGWAQASTSQADGWAQASSPQTDGWAQGSGSQTDGWAQGSAAQAGGWAQATGPQGNAQRQGSDAAGETWQATAPGHESFGRPSAENNAWPSAQAENTPWSQASAGNAGFAEAPTSTFSPAWAEADAPAARSGGALPGAAQGSPPGVPPFGGTSPDGGHPNGLQDGGDSGGENARRGYGVPDNPAMWALAAANAAAPSASSDLGAPPAHHGADSRQGGPQQWQPQPGNPGNPGQPGHHLSRDPSDPNKPFVTAGQISGPKTPPPERQQELWNTVFGDNYRAIEDEEDEERGRPVWIFALAGSVVIALLGAVLWAFLAGPLASADEEVPSDPKPAATKKSTKPAAIGRLPRFTGDASPVVGTLTDQQAGITLAQLGAPWRQDQRPGMPASYGFTTRQYLPAGTDSTGKTQFAQLMSGPLSPRLKAKYTSPENLAPVINAVASGGRNKFFPEGNTARKTAQQTLSVNGLPGQLAAYEITSGDSKTTMVVAAVSTGADLPAIVYMSVPDSKKELLPDINTVIKSIRALER